jgi:hypothetical protein
MTPGFLLTRQWVVDKDGVRLDFWLSTPDGPMSVSIHGQQALFFIRQAATAAACARVAEEARMRLIDDAGLPVPVGVAAVLPCNVDRQD